MMNASASRPHRRHVVAGLAASLEDANVAASVRKFGMFYAEILRDSDFTAGCRSSLSQDHRSIVFLSGW